MTNPQIPDTGEAGYDKIIDALMKDFHMPELYAESVLQCVRGTIEQYEREQTSL
jgi:hypothetical protein